MLGRIFGILKPVPDAPVIEDDKKMREEYRYWRLRVLYTTMIGYTGYYFVRKSLAVAMPVIEAEFGIPKAHLGLILTVFGVTYGVSKFINGFAGDRTNPRTFMALGLICSALINIFFGLSNGLLAFAIFWILNGWFQGMGWAPCSKTLVNWYSAKERGFKFAITNSGVSVGAAGVVFLNGYLVVAYGWRACFFVPGAIAIVVSLFILNRLRDRPQSLGLPPVEEYTGDEPDMAERDDGQTVSYGYLVKNYMMNNPLLWIVCLANFFVYSIRYIILDWGTTFLTQDRGIDIQQAAWIVGGYELSGMAGMLIGGWTMDKVFNGRGSRTCLIYMVFCTAVITAFWLLPITSVMANGILLCSIGFFIYGPQCLIGVVAANMVPKNVAAAAVGLTGLFGYLSTTLSGFGLGFIVDTFGWTGGFLTLVISSVITVLLFVPLWNGNTHAPGSSAHKNHSK